VEQSEHGEKSHHNYQNWESQYFTQNTSSDTFECEFNEKQISIEKNGDFLIC